MDQDTIRTYNKNLHKYYRKKRLYFKDTIFLILIPEVLMVIWIMLVLTDYITGDVPFQIMTFLITLSLYLVSVYYRKHKGFFSRVMNNKGEKIGIRHVKKTIRFAQISAILSFVFLELAWYFIYS